MSNSIIKIWFGKKRWEDLSTTYYRIVRSKFALNLFSVTGANIISKIIGLTVLGYTARVLGPENYGLYAFGSSIAAYAGVLIAPGLMTWGTRAVARDPSKSGTNLTTLNLTQFVLALIGYSCLSIYALTNLRQGEQLIVLLSGLNLFASALAVDFVFNGLEMMRIPALLGIVTQTINVIALVSLIKTPQDVYKAPLLGLLTSFILMTIEYGWLFFKRKVKLHLANWLEFRTALIAAVPLSITSILIVVLHYANNILVKVFLGTTALGIFYAAYRLIELVILIPGILGGVFLPRLSRIVANKANTAQKEALLFARVHMMIAFLIAVLFLVEAPGIINFLYGKRYDDAINLLRLMSMAVIFNFAINGYTNCLISFGRDKVMILVVVASTIVSVGGGLILIPAIGIYGAAITVALIDMAGWLISLPYYKKEVGSFQFIAWVQPMKAALISGIIALLLQQISVPFLLRVLCVCCAYLFFIRQDIRNLMRKV